MALSIRVAAPDDTAAVTRVLEASYPVLLAGAYDAALLARTMKMLTRPHPKLLAGGTYFLAEEEGEPVGCGGWSLWAPGSEKVEDGLAHLRHFAVVPAAVRRGVGRALYDRCERDARAAGARRFETQATLNGEPFYAALGFERVGPIDVPMGPGLDFPSILMRRAI
jgi:predicted N-acetyltransferase YhbS